MNLAKSLFVNCTFFVLACATPSLAFANNIVAGLQPTLDPELHIERQDVTINIDHIYVDTVISNSAPVDIVQTFVVPMQMNITANNNKIDILNNQVAISNSNQNVTQILKNLGVPLEPMDAMHVIDTSLNREHIRSKLMSLKLLEKDQETPLWTVKNYYYWRQTFPALTTISITQDYKTNVVNKQLKVAGNEGLIHMPWKAVKKIYNLTVHWTWDEPRSTKQMQALIEKNNPQLAEFCPTLKDYQAIFGQNDKITKVKSSLETKQISYQYLTDEINPSVIKNFSLKLITPKNMHALLCWQGETKTHGRQIMYEAHNYVPQSDLNILFIEKAQS